MTPDIARELINMYAKRKTLEGFSFSPDSYLQTELEASFMYEDTEDTSIDLDEWFHDPDTPFVIYDATGMEQWRSGSCRALPRRRGSGRLDARQAKGESTYI